MNSIIILFDDFETLDVFGPVEVLGRLPQDYKLGFYSMHGGIVKSKQNVEVQTLSFDQIDSDKEYLILLPGGQGTRPIVNDAEYIEKIKSIAEKAKYVLTVCTGSAVLAKTGLLKGKNATSNKIAFDWVTAQDADVNWKRKARWVNDGKYYSSSGVSAGIDMTLGFIADMHGKEIAVDTAKNIEYIWNKDKDNDPFAV